MWQSGIDDPDTKVISVTRHTKNQDKKATQFRITNQLGYDLTTQYWSEQMYLRIVSIFFFL